MYSDSKSFIEALNKVLPILRGPRGFKILYGKIADIIPITETIRAIADDVRLADKSRREERIKKFKDLNAPPIMYAAEQKQLDACTDLETWLNKSQIGSAFRNIWGKKGML